ncbi:MAG: alpha/beta fold hydrolase [Acidimicrobiia bacterium]
MVEDRTPGAPTVVVDGITLECRVIGHRREPTLVFLHEGLGSMDLWRDFPVLITETTGRAGLVYSRQGHGWSDPLSEPRTPHFMHHEALSVLPRLLEQLSVPAPILVGHSEGASIALIHAGAGHPVSGLVLLAPLVFVEDESIAGIEVAREQYETGDLPRRMAKHHADPEATFRAWNDIWLSPGFRSWNIESFLRGIDCPVLLIRGSDDEYGTVAHLDAIEEGVTGPVERLALDDCDHSPHLSQPDLVLDVAARFVRTLAK